MKRWIVFVSLLIAASASAGTLQYDTTNMNVTGYAPNGVFDPDANRATLSVASEPAWNAPTGCALDSRAPYQWTRITTLSPLATQLNPDLIFFQCTAVTSLIQMRAVMKAKVNAQLSLLTGADKDITTAALSVMAFGEELCNCSSLSGTTCVANTTANCNTIRSNNATIGARLGTFADVVTLQTALINIFTEFNNVKTTQCSGGNANFCG